MKSQYFRKEKLLSSTPLEKFQARFIFLSKLEDESINKLMYLIILVSYAQVFFFTTYILQNYLTKGQAQTFALFQALQKALMIENTFNYNKYDDLLVITCCLVILYICLMIISFLVVLYDAFRPIRKNFIGKWVWPFLIHVHGFVCFFPINNICIQIQIKSWNDELKIFSTEGSNKIAFYFSIMISLANAFFAIIPYFFVFDILPGRYLLASKSFTLDQITLCQKLLLPLWLKYLPNTVFVNWLIMGFDITLSSMRLFWYQYSLPRYNFKILFMELYLINLCLLSSVVAFVTFVTNNLFDYGLHIKSFAIMLILLVPVTLIYSCLVFKKNIIRKIVLDPFKKLNSYKALHKVLALKFIEKYMRHPNRHIQNIDTYYFYFSIIRISTQKIFGISHNEATEIEFNSREQHNELKRKYLENLTDFYSKRDEFKLILARFYARSLNLYILAIRTLARIKSRSFSIQGSARFLQIQIQEQLLKQAKTNDNQLNLQKFLTSVNQKKAFKEEIVKQLSHQNEFWKEFSKDQPEVLKLQRLSELIYLQKKKISKKWEKLENKLDGSINYLCSLYGCYQYLLNDSSQKGREYIKKVQLFNQRCTQQEFIDNSNLYDPNNFSITIRTHQDSVGFISECSYNVKRALGYEKKNLIGSNICNMISPYVGERHNSFIQDYIKTGHSVFLGRFRIEFIKNHLGFSQKVSLWTNIHPFIEEEVQLTGLFRIIHDSKEYIFLTPQGDIDSYTEGIASKLGLHNKKIHIKTICPNFDNICEPSIPLSPNQETENVRLSSAEETFISGKPLLSPMESPNAQKTFQKSLLSNLNNELKIKGNQTDVLLEFKPVPNNQKTRTRNYLYQCQAKTVNVKETFLIAIEVEMVEKEFPIRMRNLRRQLTLTLQKYKNLKLKDDAEDYNTGAAETLNPLQSQKEYTENINNEVIAARTETKPEIYNQDVLDDRIISLADNPMSKNNPINPKLDKKETKNGNMLHKGAENSVSGGSVSQQNKKQINVDDIFETKYYPKMVVFYLGLLAIIFSAAFILQIFVQIKANTDIQSLKALSTTLILANQRADTLAQLGRGARAAYFSQGGFLPKGSAAFKNSQSNAVLNFKTNMPLLKDYNLRLQQTIQDIDPVFQQKFKETNVRIFDVNANLTAGAYQVMSTFVAINVLIDKILKTISYFNKNSEYYLQDIYWLLMNSMNDIIVGTGVASDLVFQKTFQSFDESLKMIQICQIFITTVLCSGALLLIIFLLKTYNYELDLAHRYMGISPESIHLIRNRLEYFEKVNQSDCFDHLSEFDLNTPSLYEKKLNVEGKKQVAKSVKKLSQKNLQRFYVKKVFLLIFMILTYITAVYFVINEISDKVEGLRFKVNAINKLQSFLYETSILAFTLSQILCGDNLVTVRNKPSEDEYKRGIKSLLQNSYDVLDAFTEKDGTYDPLVVPFFFQNPCELIPASYSTKPNCISIVKDSNNYGLFSILSRQYNMMSEIYQDYLVSNKTFAVFSTLIQRTVTNIVPSTNVIRDLLQIMIGQVRTNLSEFWDTTKSNINIVLSICICAMLIMGLTTWILVLKHFAECSNRFKRMMRIIPFNILMRNPGLKGILMITSKEKLQKLNNHIQY